MQNVIAYYRVSTKKQGQSGLGLEGQESAVAQHVEKSGAKLVATYTEIESGKLADRPELLKAIAHAKRSKATLVVAKLDRLARNVAFLSALMDSGCEFVACDNPTATRFTIHILSAVAEHEAKMISERTRTALAMAKRRGVLLGSSRPQHWKGNEQARLKGAKTGTKVAAQLRTKQANEAYADLYAPISEMRNAGKTLQAIADQLNAQGHTTRNGKAWQRMQVLNVLKRIA